MELNEIAKDKRIKAVCPLCGWVLNARQSLVKGGIDGVKCTPCFHGRSTFVNLVKTRFEKMKG